MRSQSYTLQQALTPEATNILKQAINSAKRRNHSQVTPLHVADTMLSAPTGLLRAACLQTHAHPLHCRPLVLCFNIALNRLPTSTPSPMSGPFLARTDHNHPTIANALLAAFKRAQAHQRRGSIENQQQPLLQVKVELEQLIISILDDPSVSRVMREAGFSSILVKGQIEQAISQNNKNDDNNNISDNNISENRYNDNNAKIKVFNNSINNNNESDNDSSKSSNNNNVLSMGQLGLVKMMMGKPRLLVSNYNQERVKSEDVERVIDSLVLNKRKRNTVIVGECMATLECLVKEVMNRVEKCDVHEVLKDVKFAQVSFSSFGHLSREEVLQRLEEIKCVVKNCCLDNENNNINNKGLILYFDDFNWANEFRASNNNILVDQYQPIRRNYYCPIEHMIMEIGKLVLSFVEKKLWIFGIATFQTYMKCQSGHPSLETLWGLHAITTPLDSLGLSLISNSDEQSPLTKKKSEVNGNGWLMLDDSPYGGRANDIESQQNPCRITLPPWLQRYKEENTKRMCIMNNNDKDYADVNDLCKRWRTTSNSCMQISPTQTSSPSFETTLSLSSISPSSSTSNFYKSFEPTLTMSIKDGEDNDHLNLRQANMFISSNPNSTPTSTSSSDINEPTIDQSSYARKRFNEYNDDNLRTICNILEEKVPRQKEIVFDIASTILNCRCGSSRRNGGVKEDTWLFFQGNDVESKENIAKELARLIFGSQDKFISIGLSNFSSTRNSYSLEDCRNKRLREEDDCIYIERFLEAVSRDPHRVFFIEDIDQVDYGSQMLIKKAIERGKIDNNSGGEEVITRSAHSSAKIPTPVCFEDAIIILSCEKFRSKSRVCSPSTKLNADTKNNQVIIMNKGENKEIGSPNISLDLNLSINDEEIDIVNSRSIDETGFLAMVDKCVVFKNR